MNRLELPPDCTTAADVAERQKRVRQFRQKQKVPTFEGLPATVYTGPRPPPLPPRPVRSPAPRVAKIVARPPVQVNATIGQIKDEIIRQLGIPADYLILESRELPIVKYRHLGMALALRAGKYRGAVALAFGIDPYTVDNAREQMAAILDVLNLPPSASICEWVAGALPLMFAEIEEIRTAQRGRFKDRMTRKRGRFVRARKEETTGI